MNNRLSLNSELILEIASKVTLSPTVGTNKATIEWLWHYATSRKVAGSRSGEVNFPIYLILRDALGPGVYLVANRNEYQKQKK
jgi:hypothetical protein